MHIHIEHPGDNSRLVADGIPGLVAVMSPAGELEAVNVQLVEYCGRTLGELKRWGTDDTVHSEDLPRVIELFTSSIKSGDPYDFEARIRRFDGVYRWHQVRGSPLKDANARIIQWYVLLTDIDERKRAEEKALEAERELQRTIDNIPVGVATFAADGSLLSVNKRAREGTGLSVDDVRNGRWLTAIHPDDIGPFEREWRACVASGEPFERKVRARAADGTYRWHLRRRLPARDAAGKVIGWYGIGHDIENRKRAEEKTAQAEAALDKVRSELAHVTRVMTFSALTASIAHEVNQPLAGIITNCSACLRMLAADQPNVDGASEAARRAIRDGNRAADVIARLRVLFSKKAAVTEAVELNEATREVLTLASNDLLRNKVVLQAELADDQQLLVTGDRVQLQQVILNLVRNASDAMSEVNDRSRHLLVRADTDEEGCARLIVRDVGVGFEPQDAERLFDTFYTTKSDGMGIGLSICRTIIESHGGKLLAERNNGPGATFSFAIPQRSTSTEDRR